MTSRYKASIGFIKCFADENPYRLETDKDFVVNLMERPDGEILKDFYKAFKNAYDVRMDDILNSIPTDDSVLDMMDRLSVHDKVASSKYPYAMDPVSEGHFYMNLLASLRFTYQIERTLDDIEYDGLTFERTEALHQDCCFLATNSSNVMMKIDDEFDWNRHYMLCDDMVVMSDNMHKISWLYISYGRTDDDKEIGISDILEVTRFDNIEYRLSCKYIQESLRVIKLFIILVMLRISPFYSDDVHLISDKLIRALWETLYDKRVFRTVINGDLEGWSKGFHKSTRIKLFFAMGNSDRYCIRVDFPHDDVNYIHLNIDQPGNVTETGFPLDDAERREVVARISKESFDELFYERDGAFWFRSGFKSIVSDLFGKNSDMSDYLLEMLHGRGHIYIGDDSDESKRAVSEFSAAFAEAMVDSGFLNNPYGDVTDEDGRLYQYYQFQDYLFDKAIRMRGFDLDMRIGIHRKFENEVDYQKVYEMVREDVGDYIRIKFPFDDKLCVLADSYCTLEDLLEGCVDRLYELGI